MIKWNTMKTENNMRLVKEKKDYEERQPESCSEKKIKKKENEDDDEQIT